MNPCNIPRTRPSPLSLALLGSVCGGLALSLAACGGGGSSSPSANSVSGVVLDGNATLDEQTAATKDVLAALDTASFDGFDLTVLPIGAYDRRWADIHMNPAEAVQTHLDVRGEVLLPIHWATFNLAFHAWDDPIEWAVRESAERAVRLATPRVGQRFEVTDRPTDSWWRLRK